MLPALPMLSQPYKDHLTVSSRTELKCPGQLGPTAFIF